MGRGDLNAPRVRRREQSRDPAANRKICGLLRFVPQVLRYHAGIGEVAFMVSQPYVYQRHELAEPDWRRFPGWAEVSAADWESAQWQRAHCVKNGRQLRQVTGPGLADTFFADLERDQRERATMSMLLPPQMLNTMVPATSPGQPGFTEAFYADPVRRYMIPAFSDRRSRLALPPVRAARLAARGGDVGGGGPHPPLPHQGARRAAAHLPAVLRPLHPDGPGRQPHPGDRQA